MQSNAWSDVFRQWAPLLDGPIVVSHPLRLLQGALETGPRQREPAWPTAYIALRDVAEGIGRLYWLTLLQETYRLMEQTRDPSSHSAEVQRAIQDTLSTMRNGFTMGTVGWLARQDTWKIFAALKNPALRHSTDLWKCEAESSDPWIHPFQSLTAWRNEDPGHGCLGSIDRLPALFEPSNRDSKHHPFAALCRLLRSTQHWILEVGNDIHPHSTELDAEARSLTATQSPLMFTGDGDALWLTEGTTLRRQPMLLLRGVVTGRRRMDIRVPSSLLRWADVYVAAQRPLHTADTDPLAMTGRLASKLSRIRHRHHTERDIKPGALLNQVQETMHRHPRTMVMGRSGSGKSRLLRYVTDYIRAQPDQVVIRVSPQQRRRLSPNRVVHAVNSALLAPDSDVYIDEDDTGLLATSPDAAQRFWRALARQNPHLTFQLVIDGLAERDVAPLEDILPPIELENCRVVLACRGEKAPDAQGGLDAQGDPATTGIVNVDAFYRSADGRDTLLRYLRRRHPGLPTSTLDALLTAADHRFLAVFHYARAVELKAIGEDIEAWPEPSELYPTLLRHLEAKTGDHPGYSLMLRRFLLTLAHISTPVDDATLVLLLGGGRSGAPSAMEQGWSWLLPVLEDTFDLHERALVSEESREGHLADSRAHLLDAIASSPGQAHSVTALLHASLGEYLRDGDLSPEWSHAREVVRQTIQAATRDAVHRWVEDAELNPCSALPPPTAYALESWLYHQADTADALDTELVAAWAKKSTSVDMQLVASRGKGSRWTTVFEQALESSLLPESQAIEITSKLADLYGMLGRWELAIEGHRANIALVEAAFGETSVFSVPARTNLSYALGHVGRNDEAIAERQRAIEIGLSVADLKSPEALAEALRSPEHRTGNLEIVAREVALAFRSIGALYSRQHEYALADVASATSLMVMGALVGCELQMDALPTPKAFLNQHGTRLWTLVNASAGEALWVMDFAKALRNASVSERQQGKHAVSLQLAELEFQCFILAARIASTTSDLSEHIRERRQQDLDVTFEEAILQLAQSAGQLARRLPSERRQDIEAYLTLGLECLDGLGLLTNAAADGLDGLRSAPPTYLGLQAERLRLAIEDRRTVDAETIYSNTVSQMQGWFPILLLQPSPSDAQTSLMDLFTTTQWLGFVATGADLSPTVVAQSHATLAPLLHTVLTRSKHLMDVELVQSILLATHRLPVDLFSNILPLLRERVLRQAVAANGRQAHRPWGLLLAGVSNAQGRASEAAGRSAEQLVHASHELDAVLLHLGLSTVQDDDIVTTAIQRFAPDERGAKSLASEPLAALAVAYRRLSEAFFRCTQGGNAIEEQRSKLLQQAAAASKQEARLECVRRGLRWPPTIPELVRLRSDQDFVEVMDALNQQLKVMSEALSAEMARGFLVQANRRRVASLASTCILAWQGRLKLSPKWRKSHLTPETIEAVPGGMGLFLNALFHWCHVEVMAVFLGRVRPLEGKRVPIRIQQGLALAANHPKVQKELEDLQSFWHKIPRARRR